MSGCQQTGILGLIAQFESNFNPTAKNPYSTASGCYQIINGTWQQFAPGVGVDTNLYPTAGSAPPDVQTSVAQAIYNAQGIGPWSSNTNLMNALGQSGQTASTSATLGGDLFDASYSDPTGGMNPETGAPIDPTLTPGGSTLGQQGAATSQAIRGFIGQIETWIGSILGRSLFGIVAIVLLAVGLIALFIEHGDTIQSSSVGQAVRFVATGRKK